MLLRVVRELAYFDPIDGADNANQGALYGDAARNIETEGGALSFFDCGNRDEEVEAAIAVASGRPQSDDVEYVVLDESDLTEIGLVVDRSEPGTTALASANARHVNVVGVRLTRIADLAFTCATKGKPGVVSRKQVLAHLVTAATAGKLDTAQLRKTLAAEISAAQAKLTAAQPKPKA